jgi:hypothetical protein
MDDPNGVDDLGSEPSSVTSGLANPRGFAKVAYGESRFAVDSDYGSRTIR